MNLNFITPELHRLRQHFNAAGFDLRLVGGVVRDLVAGCDPKDIDLCTDATPDEQISVYNQNNIRWIGTGLDHGTITVVLNNQTFEITSLRVDVDTDGRHATVKYTADWIKDLERRDLTINAMSLTFNGQLIDPFGGREDLVNGVIRFVGDPVARIREDYLRILRYFRFHVRFGRKGNFNSDQWQAVVQNAAGLEQISRERVWSEIKQILKNEGGEAMLGVIDVCDIGQHMDLPRAGRTAFTHVRDRVQAPELIMAAWCAWDSNKIMQLAQAWKWSSNERDHALWICKYVNTNQDLCKLIAVHNAPRDWVVELAKVEDRPVWERELFTQWQFDPFPVTGLDLIAKGIKPSPKLGATLSFLKEKWAEMGYVATKEELLKLI